MIALSAGARYSFMIETKRRTANRISEALEAMGILDLNEIYTSESAAGIEDESAPLGVPYRTGQDFGDKRTAAAEEQDCLGEYSTMG